MNKIINLLLTTIFTISSFGNNNRECYVSYEIDGYKSLEKFTVYVQNRSNPVYYYGFEISHEQDLSESINSDQFRLQKGFIYKLVGDSMQLTGLTALASGESECVYRASNTVDFTGGFHGDEKLTEINFYLDGVRLSDKDLSNSFYLKPCSEFSYIQKSNMFKTFRKGDFINSNHQIEASHIKHTLFKNSGYETYNTLEWKRKTTIVVAYLSISCIGTDIGEFAQSDSSEICKFDRSSKYKLEEVNNNIHIWNETNGTSVKIKSEFSINNDQSIQFIWDKNNYNKYYRNAIYDKPIIVNEGDIWKSSTQIIYFMR